MRRIAIVVAMALLAGCQSTAPKPLSDKARNEPSDVSNWQEPQSVRAQQVVSLVALIDMPEVAALVNHALALNPNLQQTRLTMDIARAQVGVSRADQLPTVDAAFSGQRGKNENKSVTNSYSSELSVSWELDLWRKLADQTASAAASASASTLDYVAARDSLAASVIDTYLAQLELKQLLTVQQQLVKAYQNNVDFILDRYRSGLDNLDALATARTSLYSAQATLAQYQENIDINRRVLRQYLGDNSVLTAVQGSHFPEVLVPLAKMPNQTLAGRPDVAAALMSLRASELDEALARKDLLPSISLSAALSQTATTPSEALFTSPLWSLLGQITAPLYEGGKLRANLQAAKLTSLKGFENYRSVLQNAVKEVEDALGQEQSLGRQQRHLQDAVESGKQSLDNTQERYRSGLSDIFDLISAQTTYYNLKAQLIETHYQRLTNRVTLGLALGLPAKAEDRS
ncbi:efflux transporter outer membrane subunit [Gallaecimonas mangrovi]|uniref:efflux transporter outer membrane subunit n=1 Tax=Gallaecimonas mangrovi TaxID=2291597 RepID=UPI000E202AD8|nr:TolC family protein [Gallaecimonas mangrovi]